MDWIYFTVKFQERCWFLEIHATPPFLASYSKTRVAKSFNTKTWKKRICAIDQIKLSCEIHVGQKGNMRRKGLKQLGKHLDKRSDISELQGMFKADFSFPLLWISSISKCLVLQLPSTVLRQCLWTTQDWGIHNDFSPAHQGRHKTLIKSLTQNKSGTPDWQDKGKKAKLSGSVRGHAKLDH